LLTRASAPTRPSARLATTISSSHSRSASPDMPSEAAKNARLIERHETDMSMSDGSGAPRPIFKNSALFSHTARMSPSHGSSASPRRFHSDWSDPHATDIDVYCQCSCTCVYEEECRRTCELVYGRSPSVSSSRSCTRRGYRGFKSLPPAMDNSILKYGRPGPDMDGGPEKEPAAYGGKPFSSPSNPDARRSAERTYIRANALDELPDPQDADAAHERQLAQGSTLPDHRYTTHSTGRTYDSRQNLDVSSDRKHTSRKPQYVEDPRKTQGRTHRSSGNTHPSRRVPLDSKGTPRPYRSAESSKRKTDSGHGGRSGHPGSLSPYGRDDKSRVSSRRVASSAPERSSGYAKRQERARTVGKDEESEAITIERRRREAEEQDRHRASMAARSGRVHTGPSSGSNNFVVRRNGLPPSGHSVIPQPYRATDYQRDSNAEYNPEPHSSEGNGWPGDTSLDPYEDVWEKSSSGFGPTPVVEPEYAPGGAGRGDSRQRSAAKQSSTDSHGYASPGDHGRREPHERKPHRKSENPHPHKGGDRKRTAPSKGTTRPSSGQVRATSRQTSKSSSRSSRTPIFGIF